MVVDRHFKEDRKQIVFYPVLKLANKLDAFVAAQEGKKSRSYILEMILVDWFDRTEKERKDEGKE